MTDKTEQTTLGNGPTEERTEAERIYDEQIERMEEFLAGLSPGVSVLIERIEPSWCRGPLENHILDGEGLTLEYLIDNWGGKVLRCKIRERNGRFTGHYAIPLYSYPPLLWGEPIERESFGNKFRRRDEVADDQQRQVIVQQPPNQMAAVIQAAFPAVLKYIENQQAQRAQDFQIMLQMIQRQNGSGLNDISKVAATMTSLKDMFGNAAPANGPIEDGDFMAQAMDVLKMAMGPGTTTAPAATPSSQPSPPALTAPSPPPKKKRGRPPKKRPADPDIDNVTPLRNVAQTLAEMDPDTAVRTVKDSLGAMSPEKRDQAISAFLKDFYDEMQGTDG